MNNCRFSKRTTCFTNLQLINISRNANITSSIRLKIKTPSTIIWFDIDITITGTLKCIGHRL